MKKFALVLGAAMLLVGGGCAGGSSADVNDIDTTTYTLRVPDSVTVGAIEDGYRVHNFDAGAPASTYADNAYYVDITTVDWTNANFINVYSDATETTLGLNDAAVWSASGYDTGDGIWTEDAYFNEANGTLIVEHYIDAQGIVLAELLVGAITWK